LGAAWERALPTHITTTVRDLEATATTDERAADELLDAVYYELKALAAALTRRQKPGQTIQATDLVHEAYMRLLGNDDGAWNGRGHFFGAAAQAMRRILVEQARRKATQRRGGGWHRKDIHDACIDVCQDPAELLALDEALDRLEAEDPIKATLVKLRHFTGMTIPQASKALGISHATAERYWTYSRARLHQWIEGRAGTQA
jgi:RNA polymerase sigma factor (TIGR02999 family)